MSKFENLLIDYANINFEIGEWEAEEYNSNIDDLYTLTISQQKQRDVLIKRDKKLVEALKAVVSADYSQAKRIALDALDDVGELG